jgi:hypothetical protein
MGFCISKLQWLPETKNGVYQEKNVSTSAENKYLSLFPIQKLAISAVFQSVDHW